MKEIIQKYLAQITDIRREIHKNPELGFNEVKTGALVSKTLTELGIKHETGIGKTGIVGIIEGAEKGKVIAIRADMDALPITEITGLPYSSTNEGVSHSCGHDMHTACLLGVGAVLNEMRNTFNGTIKLIFQPAEENADLGGGSPGMIADGVLENPKVDAILGLHVWPAYETGTVAIRHGAMMASSDYINIEIYGRGSHASTPQNGIDAIVAGSAFITSLQSIVSRNVNALDSAVVTIGMMNAGERYNVICNKMCLEGTIRTLNPEVRNAMPERVERILKGTCEAYGATYKLEYHKRYSPVVNDKSISSVVVESMKKVVGDENVIIPEHSALGGEDFSFFGEKVPSTYFWLGCRTPGTSNSDYYNIHHGAFNPDENCMPIGIEVMVTSALDLLNK